MLDASVDGSADPALGDQNAGEVHGRDADVIEADHVGPAPRLGSGNHRLGIRQRDVEWVLAEDGLSAAKAASAIAQCKI